MVMDNENCFDRNFSMSSDGTRVAVIYRDGLGPGKWLYRGKGIVIVYEYNANAASGSQWQQLGTNVIETDTAGDGLLASISLSGDGNRLAIGAPTYRKQPDGLQNAGQVRLFELSFLHVTNDV